MRDCSGQHLSTSARECVDDVLIKTIGDKHQVVALADFAINDLVNALKAKDCKISVKTNLMGSTTKM
eukprot:9380827-Heterocapsa_arctica.AAC.1